MSGKKTDDNKLLFETYLSITKKITNNKNFYIKRVKIYFEKGRKNAWENVAQS